MAPCLGLDVHGRFASSLSSGYLESPTSDDFVNKWGPLSSSDAGSEAPGSSPFGAGSSAALSPPDTFMATSPPNLMPVFVPQTVDKPRSKKLKRSSHACLVLLDALVIRLGLTDTPLLAKATALYNECRTSKLLMGRSTNLMLPALVVVACQQLGLRRSLRDVFYIAASLPALNQKQPVSEIQLGRWARFLRKSLPSVTAPTTPMDIDLSDDECERSL